MTFEQFIEALKAKLNALTESSVEINHTVCGEIEVIYSNWSCILKIEDVVKAKLYQVKDWNECIHRIASSIKEAHDDFSSRCKASPFRIEVNME